MRALIDEIYGVWRFHRPAGHIGRARSTPGHLIHFVASGEYRLTTDNREYDLSAGDLVHYFESEEVTWNGGDQPVTFYSIGLNAPRLTPPDLSSRVLRGRNDLQSLFVQAFELYKSSESLSHRLELVSVVSGILAEFYDTAEPKQELDQSLWWQLENTVKRERLFRGDLSELCEIAGYSRATIIRACKASTGTTPIARLRDLRMEEAKGLLLYSMSTITDVAIQLGYSRIHEFSREFSKVVGVSPTTYRKRHLRAGK